MGDEARQCISKEGRAYRDTARINEDEDIPFWQSTFTDMDEDRAEALLPYSVCELCVLNICNKLYRGLSVQAVTETKSLQRSQDNIK